MPALVDLETVNRRLKLDLDPAGSPMFSADIRTPDIEAAMVEATDIVLDFITQKDDTWDVDTVPGRVRSAILLVTKALMDDQDKAEMLRGLAAADLQNPVVGLLYRLRDPSLA